MLFGPSEDVVVGIDPGLTGALAALTGTGDYGESMDMPHADGRVVVADVGDFLVSLAEVKMVVIEQVHSMPKQGVVSTFKFGRSYGCIEGIVAALGFPVTEITPQRWKRRMGVTADKESARAKAIELWPEARGDFARKKDCGRAEAALIAKWWIERNGS